MPSLRRIFVLYGLLAACFGGCFANAVQAAETTGAHGDSGIAWVDGDVDAAFAQARASGKPVFLYWGAVWCPPCNQVKATIFKRPDFIERSRLFVSVYLDGDQPSAQKLGTRFKVRGYPTMLLMRPDGSEITRLPGEVDAQRYMDVLRIALEATRPIGELVAATRSAPAQLGADDWRRLAWYSWDTDERQLGDDPRALVQSLAGACRPKDGDACLRLALNALALRGGPDAPVAGTDDPAARALLRRVLASPELARANFDILSNSAADIVGAISAEHSAVRAELSARWSQTLGEFANDASLSQADRLGAVEAQVELARLDKPEGALPDTLLAAVRAHVARADRAVTDGIERQSVIPTAAYALERAGLDAESDALLRAELTRSHSPYYAMAELAANARKRGDKTAALDWYERAWSASTGPATRLQWGAGYVNALIDLAPSDAARIEAAAQAVIGEVDGMPGAFYERNQRSLERMGGKLAHWNAMGDHEPVIERLRGRIDAICTHLPADDPQRAACAKVVATTAVRKSG